MVFTSYFSSTVIENQPVGLVCITGTDTLTLMKVFLVRQLFSAAFIYFDCFFVFCLIAYCPL